MAIRNVPGTYSTISSAVAAAAAGDTIFVTSPYAGNEFVNVTVDSLFFNAPSTVPGITLNAAAGVTAIILSGNSSIQVNGNAGTNVLIGDAGNNRLYGMGGNDLLLGGDGNDWVIGGAGNDFIDGGAGIDVTMYEDATSAVTVNLLTGMATDGLGGTDTLLNVEAVHGSKFGDTLTLSNASNGYAFGRAGNDKITGGFSNDTIYGGSGADTIDGGDGIDTVSYFDDGFDSAGVSTKGVIVNLATGKATDNWGAADTLVKIENVTGSSKADTITGDAARNILRGGAGDDKLNGGDGNDDLYGEDGNDTLTGGHGINYYQSSAGNDVYDGGTGYDFSWWARAQDFDTVDYRFGPTTGVNVDLSTGTASDGQGGTDTLKNIEQVYGSSFNDVLKGGGGPRFQAFRGGAGDDTIIGSGIVNTRADYIDSTGGVTINLTGAADGLGTVTGGSTGNDTVRYVNQFFGSNYNDIYDASAYTLSMPQAGSGFNQFRGGAGNDTIIGNGNTRLDFGSANTGITFDFGRNKVGDGQGGIDTFSGVNAVVATAYADILRGTAAGEVFAGQGGDDLIEGGGGNDEARYDTGTSPITMGITVDMAAGTVVGDPIYVGNDTISGIEGIRGSLLDDVYVATGFAGGGQTGTFRDGPLANVNYNRFAGLSGNDTITGNGQTSIDYRGASAGVTVTFTGQGQGTATGTTEGTDTFTGVYSINDSPFDDVLKGSNVVAAGYWEVFNLSGGNDTVAGGGGNDDISFSAGSNAGVNVVFTGVGAGKATGNGTDTFTGIEFVTGSSKDDKMVGGAGSETFAGIGGNDKLDGGAGTDTVSYFFDGKGVTVDLTAGTALDGSGGTDTLANFENVTGSVFGDMITGNTAANLLDGLAGDDRLDGLAGKDTLKGGAGKDTFAFTTALGSGNVDTVADFVSSTDRLELSQSIFSALGLGALSAAAFVQAAAAATTDQHVIYNSTTGVVSYDADGKGGAAAVAFAKLTPGQTLVASDFLIT